VTVELGGLVACFGVAALVLRGASSGLVLSYYMGSIGFQGFVDLLKSFSFLVN